MPGKRLAQTGASLFAVALTFSACTSTSPDLVLADRVTRVRENTVELPAEPYRGFLTLQTAITRASAASEDVAILASAVDIAAQEKLMAGDMRDPELRASYGSSSSDGDRVQTTTASTSATGISAPRSSAIQTLSDDQTGYAIALRIFPPNPWERAAAISASTAATYISIAELLQAKWQLNNQIRRLFIQIHFQAQSLKVYREMTEVYGQALKVARERARQGHGTIDDVMATARRYLAAVADRDTAARDQAQAREELARLVAIPIADLHPLMDERLLNPPQIASAATGPLEEDALGHRRDLAALYWSTVQAKEDLRGARGSRMPWFTHVQAGFGSGSSQGDSLSSGNTFNALGLPQRVDTSQTSDNEDQTEWSIQAAISLPIIPGANHAVDVSLAQYRSAGLREGKARERVRREIRNALAAVKAIEAGRQQYEEDTRELSHDMEEALRTVKDATMLDPLALARMREQILETQRIRIESEMDYHLAVIRLEEVLGKHLPGR